jgi:hypothetical protein
MDAHCCTAPLNVTSAGGEAVLSHSCGFLTQVEDSTIGNINSRRQRDGPVKVRLTQVNAVAGRSFSFSFSLKCLALFAHKAFGQVLGSALLRNAIAPFVTEQNS